MTARVPSAVPAAIAFGEGSGRAPAWGRFTELAATGAWLATRAPLSRGESLALDFELAGEPYAGVLARVAWTESDADGWTVAALDFTDHALRRRLGRALVELMSRAV